METAYYVLILFFGGFMSVFAIKKVYRGRAFSWEIYRQSIGVDVDDHQWF